MLSALAVASAFNDSVVSSQFPSPKLRVDTKGLSSITVGQPAGLSQAAAALGPDGSPKSIAYVRTARRLFQGDVLVRDEE